MVTKLIDRQCSKIIIVKYPENNYTYVDTFFDKTNYYLYPYDIYIVFQMNGHKIS